MKLLNDIIQDLHFDKRIVEWGIRYKLIKREEHQKYMESLPDLSDKKEDLILEEMRQSEGSSSEG